MIIWFVTNSVLTIFALLFIYTNRTSPHRMRFLVSITAMCAWLVPWNLLGEIVPATTVYEFTQVQQAFSSKLQSMALLPAGQSFEGVNTFSVDRSVTPVLIYVLLMSSICGIAAFAMSIYQHNQFLSGLSVSARPGNYLLRSFSGTCSGAFEMPNVKIFIQDKIPGAMCSGMFLPTIWIHEDLVEDCRLPAVLLHELNHVHQKDNYYLFIIAFIEKLFWWNPLVVWMGSQSRKLQELSCDEDCAESMPEYRKVLSSLILDHIDRDCAVQNGRLSLTILKEHNFNILRIKQLEGNYAMKPKHIFNLVLTCCTAIISVSIVTAQTSEFSQAEFERNALLGVGMGGKSVNGEMTNIAFLVNINRDAEFSMYYPDTHLITLLTAMVDMQRQLKAPRNIDKATGEERADPDYALRLEVVDTLDIASREIIDKNAYGVVLPPGRFDNLSLQATLSLLAEQSNCSITKEGSAIVVDNCDG